MLSLNLSTFEVCSLSRLWTGMGLMCPHAEHLQQCQRSQFLYPMSELFTFVFLSSIIMAPMVSFGRQWARSICSIFPLCIKPKSVASRFFKRTPSKIRRIVRIFDVVDRFLRKPFWFFQIFSQFHVWCGKVGDIPW